MDKYGRKVQWDVRRSVYVASFFYIFYYGGKACLFPFLTLYLRQLGLTASQTGLALGVKALVWFCVTPIWMTLVHRVNKTRAFLCYSIFIVIGSNLSLSLLPPADPTLPVQFCVNESPPIMDSIVGSHASTILPFTTVTLQNETKKSPFGPDHAQTNESVQHTSKVEKGDFSTGAASTTVASPGINSNNIVTLFPTLTTLNATARSNTTSYQQIDSSKSSFQIAKGMLSALKENGVRSDQVDIIEGFISKYDVTKDLPRWKKQVIVRHIRRLLSNIEKNNPSTKRSLNRRSTRRWSRFDSRQWFDGRRKRSASNETSGSTSILDAMKNFTNVLSEKKDQAIESLTPFVIANSYLFLCVVIILAAGELLSAPVEIVSDSALYCFLDELDNLNQYGKHRTSALVGAALGGISVSIIIYFSPCLINGSINRFHIHFYLFAFLLGIAFIVAPFYPSYDSSSSSTRSRVSGASLQKCPSCSLMICSSCRHFLLLITVLIVGITQAPMQNFMFWMVQDMEGSSELVYGSFVSVNAICSMISSLVGRRVIRLMKPCSAAMMSLLSIAMQLVLYAFTPNPWIILPLQLLNITGLSFLWTIVTHHTSTTMSSAYGGSEKISSVHVFARASQQRSLHATYVSVYQGLAYGFGSIISGFLYDYLHGNMMPVLVGGGILVSAWGVIFVMYQCCCLPRKLQRQYSHLLSDSDSDMNLTENAEFDKKYKEQNGNYSSVDDSRRKKRKDRKKIQRFHTTIDTETSDSDEHDWLKSTMKKESRML